MNKAYLTAGFFLIATSQAQVPPTEANLRAGILAGGLLQFSGPGTITLSTPIIVATDATVDAGTNAVKIDGQNLTQIFSVNSGAKLTLKNLTVANGLSQGVNGTSAAPNGGPAFGGAIRNNGGTVTISNCSFTNNYARGGSGYLAPLAPIFNVGYGGTAAGGAIWQSSGSLSIEGSTFIVNSAIAPGQSQGFSTGFGGAIYADAGSIGITNSTFTFSSCNSGGLSGIPGTKAGDSGGGVICMINGAVTVDSSSFITNLCHAGGNSQAYGGAILVANGSLNVSAAYFSGNTAFGGTAVFYHALPDSPGLPAYGGAISVGTNVAATLSASTLQGNIAKGGRRGSSNNLGMDGTGYGGGLFNAGAASVVNCTFSANLSTNDFLAGSPFPSHNTQEGGAIYNVGTIGITNSTIVANISKTSVLKSLAGTMTVKNTLFADNAGSAEADFVDAGNNLSADTIPTLTASSSQNNVQLKLGALADYGGPTPTYPLLAGSPAINAADDAAAPATDQRGHTRPFGSHADVGAFESSPPFTILGKINGYVNNSTTATLGSITVPVDASGNFLIQNAPQGSSSIQFAATNTLFRPNPLTFDVQANLTPEARAFAFNALAYDPDLGTPSFTFAGHASETWEFDASNNFLNWTAIHTNTFSTDSLYSMELTNLTFPAFLRGIKK